MIKAKWGPGYKVFSHKIRLKFFKKIGIFRKWAFLHKKVSTFFAGLLVQRSLEVSPGWMANVPSNLPLIKQREAYWCHFSVLVFLLLPFSSENFPADTVRAEHNVYE